MSTYDVKDFIKLLDEIFKTDIPSFTTMALCSGIRFEESRVPSQISSHPKLLGKESNVYHVNFSKDA